MRAVSSWTDIRSRWAKVDLQALLGALDPAVIALDRLPHWRAARRRIEKLGYSVAWKRGSSASAVLYERLVIAFVAHDMLISLHLEELSVPGADNLTNTTHAANLLAAMKQLDREWAACVVQRYVRGRFQRTRSAASKGAPQSVPRSVPRV
jgi:hypothetical protein